MPLVFANTYPLFSSVRSLLKTRRSSEIDSCLLGLEEMEEKEMKLGGEQRLAAMKAACRWLRERKVGELVQGKRRLVEVPYTATLTDTINALLANDVIAVPVAAPPNRWIGAGGSMILESDPVTGAVRKQYIGMVTMLDILVHIAEEGEDGAAAHGRTSPVSSPRRVGGGGEQGVSTDLDRRMLVPVSSIIGHSLEGLSLWTLNPNTSLLDCMESFSKGVHRALVPLESHTERIIAVELSESSPGYRMLTQMDVLSYLRSHDNEVKDVVSCTVAELGAINKNVFSITKHTKVIEAIKSMRNASVGSVPIVEALGNQPENHMLLERKGQKLLGTFSATDIRACPVDELQKWMCSSVLEFKVKSRKRPSFNRNIAGDVSLGTGDSLVTCSPETTLAEVIEKAVAKHVHRVWVVDGDGLLTGLISLTDILRVIRESLLSAEHLP